MAKKGYWKALGDAVATSLKGASITIRHLKKAVRNTKRGAEGPQQSGYFNHQEGIFTLKYPREVLPTPENGRYKLHNEIDDCIVCDKCAKICPVDCIDIEVVKATETIGYTSDGTAKRLHAAKFDIDMAKCCFCGLCTTVCPTECLTMTPDYDFSSFELNEMNFAFSEMTAEEVAEKKQAYEAQQAAKLKAEAEKLAEKPSAKARPAVKRPAVHKPAEPQTEDTSKEEAQSTKPQRVRPAIKRPVVKKTDEPNESEKPVENTEAPKPAFRPRVRPKIKRPTPPSDNTSDQ